MFDGVLFDLDGTLWDAVPQIAESWNRVLVRERVDRPPITVEELRPCMGLVLEEIARRLMPGESPRRQRELIALCCQAQHDDLARRGGTLYPREEETLALLRGRCPLFVVSNCQDGYIQAFYEGTGLGGYFADFECAGRTGRPKGDNIALVVERNGLKKPVYVGDTVMDQTAARAAGVPFIHAAYGFGQVEGAYELAALSDLPALLDALA